MTFSREKIIDDLDAKQYTALLHHFNSIYEVREDFDDTELNVIYLAWLWKHGYVQPENHWSTINPDVKDLEELDFDYSIDEDTDFGMNLDNVYDYYDIGVMMDIWG